MRNDVAVLYVDPLGPYPKLVTEWYGTERDARRYAGPLPIVAHPPCGPWGCLRHLCKSGGKICALHALVLVRRFGGVLEHPHTSRLFRLLPKPGDPSDAHGGRTIDVCQCDFGHVARKRTRLYIVGAPELPPMPAPREPTHWVSGGRAGTGHTPIPPGIKVCSAQQRRRTPVAFAEWLIEVASRSARP